MRNRFPGIIHLFSSAMCFFYASCSQGTQLVFRDSENDTPFFIIKQDWRESHKTLGALIDEHREYKKNTLIDCLTSKFGQPVENVISAVSPKKIVEFFQEQDLVKHVRPPEEITEGKIKTFGHTFGVEFLDHGPVEEKAINLIKTLGQQGPVNFLDIGAGYGAFGKRVVEACRDQDITIYLNECISVQCYQLSKDFFSRLNLFVYPFDILGKLNYYDLDCKFNVSTVFNVHHFMPPHQVRDSINNIYRITEDGGYHIAVALSPYFRGDTSILAKAYDQRVAGAKDTPGYFTERDILNLLLTRGGDSCISNMRGYSFFPSKEVYEKMYRDAGFRIEEAGYYSEHANIPREFSYIVAHKPANNNFNED